jgi:hypothetical protein
LAVLFKTESVHGKDACVAGDGFVPLRHHLGDAISQHAPLTEPEIKCMGNCKRNNIAWPVDQDRTIMFGREVLVAF